MASSDSNVWHQVHAQREDGVAAMFLIREIEPRADQPKIFVVELPYAVTDLSGQPDAAGYRRLAAFQEQWLEPACAALSWTFVAWKSEDGSFFLYLYGAGDPEALLEKLAPFDGELGFFNDLDEDWSEYAALRELVEQAELDGGDDDDDDEDDEDDDHAHHHHDHDHGDHEHHHHDHEVSAEGIHVIDLTGEPAPPATGGEPSGLTASAHGLNGQSHSVAAAASDDVDSDEPDDDNDDDDDDDAPASKPARRSSRSAAARPAASRAGAKPTPMHAVAKPTAKRAAAAKPAAAKPATRPVAAKPAARPAAAKPVAAKPAAMRATARPAAAKPAAKPAAAKRAAAKPAATASKSTVRAAAKPAGPRSGAIKRSRSR